MKRALIIIESDHLTEARSLLQGAPFDFAPDIAAMAFTPAGAANGELQASHSRLSASMSDNLGSWSGDPDSLTFSYQWRLDSNSISGAVQDSYSPASGAGGSYDCIVTAPNAAGSGSATTAPYFIS